MRVTRIAVACAALLSLTAAQTRAGLIANGSFESPTVPAGGFSNFAGGSTGITGWTVVGDGVSIVSGTFAQNGVTFQAQDGKQWLDLTGDGVNSKTDGVSQDVATTIGQSYQLSFYVGSTTDNSTFFPSTVDLSIGGATRVSFTNPTAPTNMLNWELFNVQFTATTASTNITFFNGDASNNNNGAGQRIPQRRGPRARVRHPPRLGGGWHRDRYRPWPSHKQAASRGRHPSPILIAFVFPSLEQTRRCQVLAEDPWRQFATKPLPPGPVMLARIGVDDLVRLPTDGEVRLSVAVDVPAAHG